MGVYCLDMFMMLVSTDVAFRGRIPVALSFGLVILCARTGTLIGSAGGVEIIRATIAADGTYTVKLYGPVDHPDKTTEDVRTINFGVNV